MIVKQLLPGELKEALHKQKYQLVGKHSAVKKCRWLHKSLVENSSCYKHKFFGISSWRCIQLSPASTYCTMSCKFCWRVQPSDIGIKFDETIMPEWDDPTSIVEGCIAAQHRILSGYKAHNKVNVDRYNEAMDPKHAAISLTGEPTLYPDLGGLVYEFHKRGFTTFIVTNGTIPEAVEKLNEEPTQLYVSVCAPNEHVFTKICRPQIAKAWVKLNKTLELLSSFSCPTVMRLTLARGLNMRELKGYAQLINKSNPTYVEPKSYMFVGASRSRLSYGNMPTYTEVLAFAKELCLLTGYGIINESKTSRVVLLSRLEKAIKLA